MNYTYILECKDGSYYCGWTNDLCKRLSTHNAGKGGKYTRSRLPVRLVYVEAYATKEEAMSREWHIKQLSRQQKDELIRSYQDFHGCLDCSVAVATASFRSALRTITE